MAETSNQILERIASQQRIGAVLIRTAKRLLDDFPSDYGAEAVRQLIICRAEWEHRAYPQYDGYFRELQLVRVTKRIETKAGLAFESGDISIGEPAGSFWEVYSPRTGMLTLIQQAERYS